MHFLEFKKDIKKIALKHGYEAEVVMWDANINGPGTMLCHGYTVNLCKVGEDGEIFFSADTAKIRRRSIENNEAGNRSEETRRSLAHDSLELQWLFQRLVAAIPEVNTGNVLPIYDGRLDEYIDENGQTK